MPGESNWSVPSVFHLHSKPFIVWKFFILLEGSLIFTWPVKGNVQFCVRICWSSRRRWQTDLTGRGAAGAWRDEWQQDKGCVQLCDIYCKWVRSNLCQNMMFPRNDSVLLIHVQVVHFANAHRFLPAFCTDFWVAATLCWTCARRFFKHFRRRSLWMMRNTDDYRMPVSLTISRTERWVFGWLSWLSANSSTA